MSLCKGCRSGPPTIEHTRCSRCGRDLDNNEWIELEDI
jgi:hypothetical protein